ncbi:SIS domain-containing protein [Paenibacillus piri]|uniref:Bifunctional phosphoglucose/phosphomannose isomerase n=1 Tax=Paenibacillus piri TaxID=2547395 RepID=A0A4R5KSP1_9BACL|nr:SIS domain-containing protein [Paenibacillus piri]TDF98068.1 bifunctional phosphoglucose/phosphomannose isomerase [Paenibacillus piri]
MGIDINDTAALTQADTQQLLAQLGQCGDLCRQGLDQAQGLPVSSLGRPIDEIVLCSVGGGPVAALRQVKSMLSDTARVPVILHQAYHMPAYVDANSLVFIVNYSGGSEEMASACRSAIEAGANVAAMTAGGVIADLVKERGGLFFPLPAGKIPRLISTSHVLIPLLVILHRMGLIPDPASDISETIALMPMLASSYGPASTIENNLAKQLAAEWQGQIPIVYGTLPFTDSAAYRLKYQLAENGGRMAFANAMSALHHDEAYGWDEAGMDRFHVTLISDAEDHERMSRRIEATAEVLGSRAGAVHVVRSRGESRLSRLCSLTHLFDYATVYDSLLRVNPDKGKALNEFRAAFNR